MSFALYMTCLLISIQGIEKENVLFGRRVDIDRALFLNTEK